MQHRKGPLVLLLFAAVVTAQSPEQDRKLLDVAARNRTPAATQLIAELLAAGANVNARDPNTGNTALLYAARYGDTALIKVLLAAGADATATAVDGSTPVSAARRIHRPDIIESLRKSGAVVLYPDPVAADELVQLSRLVRRVEPASPAGAPPNDPVKFHAVIDREGGVRQLTLLSGAAPLEEPARKAAMQWRFEPFTLDDEYVEAQTTVTVPFPAGQTGTEFDSAMGQIARDVAQVKQLNYIRRDGMNILEHAVRACAGARPPNNACADACDWYGLALQKDAAQKTYLKVEPLYIRALELRVRSPHSIADLALSLELEGIALDALSQPQRAREMQARARDLRARSIKAMDSTAHEGPLASDLLAQSAASTNGTYRIGGGVSAPAVTYKVDPQYSEPARLLKYSGTVLLSIVVDTQGRARAMEIVKGLGLGLDEKAAAAVQSWIFRPGMRDGHPVNVRARIEVNFRLL